MDEPGRTEQEGERHPRLTPYELVFTSGDFESRVFPRIQAEAAEAGLGALSRDRFDFLSTAADLVRELTPEDAPPEALEQYRALLFHAYHFWLGGRQLYVLDAATARYLVESRPALAGWHFDLPVTSAYLQLPAMLFWSSVSSSTPPEPVDGFFLTETAGVDPLGKPFRLLDVLLVLGIRRSRAGFGVIRLETTIGPGVVETWAEEGEREGGDFSNVLPGGDLAGFYSLVTAGEALKLLALAFWHVDRFPDGLVEVNAAEPRDKDEEPPATHLAHTLITLGSPPEPAGGRGA